MRGLSTALALVLALPPMVLNRVPRAAAQLPPSQLPSPTESEYFETFGGGIVIDPSSSPPRSFYAITLLIQKPLPVGSVAVAEFENPQPGGEPIRVIADPTGHSDLGDRLTIPSPALPCMINNRNYRVSISLVTAADSMQVISTHGQLINVALPPQLLRELGVAECGS